LQVALSGLRSGTKALLLNAGVTEDELPFVERAIAAANYTPVAHRLSEAFRSQSLNTAASVAAFALGTFGGDRNGDGVVGCSDLALVNAAINTRIGDPGFNVLADVNVDGVVDDRDLALVLMQLPAVLSCK
jgi:hypothetical protein